MSVNSSVIDVLIPSKLATILQFLHLDTNNYTYISSIIKLAIRIV